MKKSELRQIIREEIKSILKESYKIDTDSASDADKIKDILRKKKIKFKQTGSIITIMLNRKSAQSSMINSQFDKIVGNHWKEI